MHCTHANMHLVWFDVICACICGDGVCRCGVCASTSFGCLSRVADSGHAQSDFEGQMSDKARIAAGAAATRSKMDQATALISGLAGACVCALICASARVR